MIHIKDCIFFLGAKDPEMDRIERVLNLLSADYNFASINGVRVHPGNAYNADFEELKKQHNKTVVFIECGSRAYTPDILIDHHNPGDPGYEMGPNEYLEASSLGQLFGTFGLNPSHEDRVLAAMDHCYSDAVHGRCPGVKPEEVRNLKISSLYSRIKQSLTEYTDKLVESPKVTIGNQEVVFLDEDLGVGYSFPYLTSQIVAVDVGMPVILRSKQAVNDNFRLHL